MKKLVLSLLVSSIAFAQAEKKVEDFNKIKINDNMEVYLVHSDTNSIIIDGLDEEDAESEDQEKYIDFISKEGELQISRTPTIKKSKESVLITINYKKISNLEIYGGSLVYVEDVIKGKSFTLLVKDTSEVELSLDVENFSCKIEDSSMVTVDGSAKKQDVIVNSGGKYEGENLITVETIITSNSGEQANINASTFVVANACKNGNITISGSPMQIYQNRSEGGTVTEE